MVLIDTRRNFGSVTKFATSRNVSACSSLIVASAAIDARRTATGSEASQRSSNDLRNEFRVFALPNIGTALRKSTLAAGISLTSSNAASA